ncbi:ADP-ribosylglycohydrolase family protein [Ornithinimicrobium cerasi]|uniref:ADP-ribosylglycohydrolase n=1 Tax=Ornithinimicrobium cerasi TaxID=2248773 RepID=A0A285VDY6_9MICO|nr:ADP-ribosylglycohydrolase family protein [Ornithinimicrobium cerasi]SOC52319.1 ADP-ribosylglycohydrolase [Ornithinimicrobium cerasi]
MSEQGLDIQSAARLAKLIELSRGVLHGIALGDGADHLFSSAAVRPAGVATQLTLATVEGMIRTMERAGRQLDHDWGHESLASLRRWATGQGISGVAPERGPGGSLLAQVPGYAVRRGRAPATVAVLRHGPEVLTLGPKSLGAHALVRTLPFATLVAQHGPDCVWPAVETARVTHAHDLVGPVVAAGARLAAATQKGVDSLATSWLEEVERLESEGAGVVARRLGAAVMAASTDPHEPARVGELAPDRSALSVLTASVYAVLSHPQPEHFHLAMGLASFAPDKTSTSAVTGGLLGALNGSTPLLALGASRGELAWACDALGTDLAMTVLLTPLGREPDGTAWLAGWEARYPV